MTILLTKSFCKVLKETFKIRDDGAIISNGFFEKKFKKMGGDMKLLLSCVEDNIYEEEGQRRIDYSEAIKDYNISVGMGKEAKNE